MATPTCYFPDTSPTPNPTWSIEGTRPGRTLRVIGKAYCDAPYGYWDAQSESSVKGIVRIMVSPQTIPSALKPESTVETKSVFLEENGTFRSVCYFDVKVGLDFDYGEITCTVAFAGTHDGDPVEWQTPAVQLVAP